MDLTLREIGRLLEPLVNLPKGSVSGVSTDTRTLEKGMLFFALKGEHGDGHEHVAEAFAKGACAAVVRKGYAHEGAPAPLIAVEDPMAALQELAAMYRGRFDIPVIAVTGSNGKTGTKEMLALILKTGRNTAHSPGNLNNHIGVPLSICAWNRGTEAAVLELGTNHFGEIRRLCEIARPTHGIITNIGRAHLEAFRDMEGVLKAKSELLEYLKGRGRMYINGDDLLLLSIHNRYPGCVTYGFSEGCMFRGTGSGVDKNGHPWFKVEGTVIRLAVAGRHNTANALAAAAVARDLGVSWDHIAGSLHRYRGMEKRLELIPLGGILLVNDCYNANPDSVRTAVETVRELDGKRRKVAVLGDMLELGEAGEAEHRKAGAWIRECDFHALFAYGPEMLHAVDEARRAGLKDSFHFTTQDALVEKLEEYLEPGDIVLVKGSRGMRMEKTAAALVCRFKKKE